MRQYKLHLTQNILLDVLKNMEDDEIVMELTSGSVSPCVIENKNNE